MDIAYIGYSEVLLEQLLKNDLYNVKKVVYVPHRVNERYRNILTESKVDCFEINNKNQMHLMKSKNRALDSTAKIWVIILCWWMLWSRQVFPYRKDLE